MNKEFNINELRSVDLNLLVSLSVLVRERSVKKAASVLGTGSPAISMALARLRKIFDDPLFVRQQGHMVPTPRALQIIASVDPALRSIRLALRPLDQFDPKTIKRTVRIALADDMEPVILPDLIEILQEQAPGMTLIVKDAHYRKIDEILDTDEADIVVAGILPQTQPHSPQRILYRDRFVALYDANRVALSETLDMAAYLACPHLLVSPRGDMTGMLDPILNGQGHYRKIATTLTRFSTLPFMLRRVSMLCNVPSTSGRILADAFGLTIAELPFVSPEFDMGIVWQRILHRDPATSWLVEVITSIVARRRV